MACSSAGFEYENKVIAALVVAGAAGLIREGAGASAADADADMIVDGERYFIEVKADANAQMGGTSVRFEDGEFSIAGGAVDEDTQWLIFEALDERKDALVRFCGAVGASGFPLTCEEATWRAARGAGLLVDINAKVRRDASFIADHYAKKGIDYIQIGGSGLFYLNDNPANLPIPRLDGEVDIELRAARSGSRRNKVGVKVVGGGIRVQARLKFKGTSPFTLDDPASIREMLGMQ